MSYILSFICIMSFSFPINARIIEMPISDDADIMLLMCDKEDENDLTKQLVELITGDIFMQKYAYILLITFFVSQPIFCAEKPGATDAFFHMQHIANTPNTNGAPLAPEYTNYLSHMHQGDPFPSTFMNNNSWSVGSLLGAAAVGVGALVVNEVKSMIVYAARRRVHNALEATAAAAQSKLEEVAREKEKPFMPANQNDPTLIIPGFNKQEEVDPMDMHEFLHDGQAREAEMAVDQLTTTQLQLLATYEQTSNKPSTYFRDKYKERLEREK